MSVSSEEETRQRLLMIDTEAAMKEADDTLEWLATLEKRVLGRSTNTSNAADHLPVATGTSFLGKERRPASERMHDSFFLFTSHDEIVYAIRQCQSSYK